MEGNRWTLWSGIVLGARLWVGAVRALNFLTFIHKTEFFFKLYEIYSLSDFENCLKTYVKRRKDIGLGIGVAI